MCTSLESLARCSGGTNLVYTQRVNRERLRNVDYRSYLLSRSPGEEEEIRSRTATGRPLGEPGFTTKLESKLGRVLTACRAGRGEK